MTTVDTANGESGHELPDALPGNAGVVFTVLPKDRTNLAAYRIAVSDRPGRHTVLVPGIRARYAPPDQLLVAESDGTLAAVAFDVANHTGCRTPSKKHRPEMRVMLMSGLPDGEMSFLDHGWHFIQKPFLPSELVEKVHEVLRAPERNHTDRYFSPRRNSQAAAAGA